MKRLAVPLVLLLVAGTAWAWEAHARSGRERTLAAAASQLAGRPVGVDCQSLWSDLLAIRAHTGEVRADAQGRVADSTQLPRDTCRRLGEVIDAGGSQLECLLTVDWSHVSWGAPLDPCIDRVRIVAHLIGTLAHESMHLRGWLDEATAQCYAIQTTALATTLLGGSRALGEAVARLELVGTAGMPSQYQSGECRPGGALDLHPETPEFPTEASLALPSGFGPALQ